MARLLVEQPLGWRLVRGPCTGLGAAPALARGPEEPRASVFAVSRGAQGFNTKDFTRVRETLKQPVAAFSDLRCFCCLLS